MEVNVIVQDENDYINLDETNCSEQDTSGVKNVKKDDVTNEKEIGGGVEKIVISLEEYRKMCQRNQTLMLALIGFSTLYQSICCWNVFDAYLSMLVKEKGFVNANTWVGAAESMTGIASLIFAVPCGFLTDSMRRDKMTQFAGVIGVLVSFTNIIGFMTDSMPLIFINLIIWGLVTSIVTTAGEAIFADSISVHERSEKMCLKGQFQSAGLGLGPFIMIGLFMMRGNFWSLGVLHVPLCVGSLLGPLASIPCMMLKDTRQYSIKNSRPLLTEAGINELKMSKGLTEDGVGEHVRRATRSFSVSQALSKPGMRQSEVFDDVKEGKLHRLSIAVTNMDEAETEEQEQLRLNELTDWQKTVPYWLAAADFTMEIGAGMTVRFFPLFFINDYSVQPVFLNLIFGLYPLFVSCSINLCEKLAKVCGRPKVSFVFQAAGIISLLSMCIIDDLNMLVLVFFLRCGFQNGAYPVDRSILVDYTPSSQRGRWGTIMSLCQMTWSGSAFIGGFLTDGHDYRFTFMITALVYTLGLLLYTPLLFLVPK